jgi:hypothetical protein
MGEYQISEIWHFDIMRYYYLKKEGDIIVCYNMDKP